MPTPDDKLTQLLQEFSIAMLVTRATNGQLRARPMAVADVQDDGTIWLLTDRNSGKVDEIDHEKQVNVTMQSTMKFVSVSGTAYPTEDRAQIDKLWKENWKVWFPGGKDDPSLLLLKIHSDSGEYWDNSGLSGVKYLIEAGKAYFKGTRPDVSGDAKIHGKVTL